MSAKVVSLNVVHAEIPDVGGSVGVTAIDKRPIVDRRKVTTAGVAGDHRSDVKHHGHPNQAVYAYSTEDYLWWSTQLDRELAIGVFGENLTTTGINWNEIKVGSIIEIGTAKLQVSTPRIPCGTFQRWLGEEHWVKRFNDAGRWGSYLRVLESGDIGTGDQIIIIDSPNHEVTITDVAQVFTGLRVKEQLNRVSICPDVVIETRQKALNALANL